MWPAADRYVRSAAGPLGLMGSRPARARADSMTATRTTSAHYNLIIAIRLLNIISY